MRAAAFAIVLGACAASSPAPSPPREPPVAAVDARGLEDAPADATGAGITPRAYTIELAIDPGASGYTGTISIELDVAVRSSAIWLDASDVAIDWARLTVGDEVQELAWVVDPPVGRLGLTLPRPVDPGVARLDLSFSARYQIDEGIFAQTYRAGTYVFSDFEPVDARRAFPCFDEPRFKTPWTISLVVPDGLVALSNSEATATDDLAGPLTRVSFAPTPPLPTYLVAFAVGDFDVVDAPGGPVPVRIVVPSGRADAAARAATYAPAILQTARDFVDRDVPFGKLDIVAVPRFGGAMENPGLVTVALDILLDGRTEADERKLGLVLAHEVAHLWFGDSVTLTDWRDLWINEGLATWMADEVLVRWQPAWNTRLDEIGARHEAMAEDDAPGAHPLRPDELAGPRLLFDVLTYQKGAAILHMVEAWAGDERFLAALRGYLDAHAGGGASSLDLVAALAPLGAEVRSVLEPLLEETGVPALDVSVSCGADGAQASLSARDDRPVPACVRWRDDAGEHRSCVVVTGTELVPLGESCPRWVHPNANGDGYYRWSMDGGHLGAVIADVRATDRERLDGARAVRTALAEDTPAEEIADALAAGVRSPIPAVVAVALADYRVLIDQAAPDDAVKPIAAHLRRALAPSVKRLGTAPRAADTAADARLRGLVLTAAGLAGDKKVIPWATKAARKWLDHDQRPPDDLAEAVLLVAAAHADARLVKSLAKAAANAMDDAGADAPLFGRALGRLPATHGLAVLDDALDGSLPSMITFTLAIEQLARRDTAAAAAAQLAAQGDWLAIVLTFAPVCDPALVDQAGQPEALARRRADAARCAALTPRLADAAAAFE